MKNNNFKRQSRNWLKKSNEIYYIFNIQSSIYNDHKEIKFTFNTGLFLPKLYPIIENEDAPNFPKEYDCFNRRRIGELINKNDIWYKLTSKTNESNLISEMLKHINTYIFPHFSSISSIDDIISLFYKKNYFFKSPIDSIYMAIILLENNYIEEGITLLKKEYNRTENKTYKKRVYNISTKYSIKL